MVWYSIFSPTITGSPSPQSSEELPVSAYPTPTPGPMPIYAAILRPSVAGCSHSSPALPQVREGLSSNTLLTCQHGEDWILHSNSL